MNTKTTSAARHRRKNRKGVYRAAANQGAVRHYGVRNRKKDKAQPQHLYANYADLYALADAIREKLETDVAQLYKDDRDNKVNSNDYLRLFYHIQSNPLFYKTYFKLGYDGQYKIHLYDTQQAETYFGNKHIAYHMEFFKAGLNAIVKKWLEGGCRETPEEMNEIIHSEYQGREIVR